MAVAAAPLDTSLGSQPTGLNSTAHTGYGVSGGMPGGVPNPGPSSADLAAGENFGQSIQGGPPAPAFMTPAMQTYVGQFQQSQAAQQQAMNGALVQALAGLGSRRDSAAKVVATLPGQATKDWQAAQANAHAAGADAASAFAGPTIGGKADVHGNAARTASDKNAAVTNNPLLSAGINADVTKGETTLANTDMQNKSALAQAQQQFDQSMALAQAQYAHDAAQQQAGYAHDSAMAVLNSSLATKQYQTENPNKALTPQQTIDYQNSAALDQGAIKNGFTNYAQQQAYTNTPAYQQVESVLSGKSGLSVPDGKGKTIQVQPGDKSILKYVTDPLILKALVANGVVSGAEMAGLYGQTKP